MADKQVKIKIIRNTYVGGNFQAASGDKDENIISVDEKVAREVVEAGKAEYLASKSDANAAKTKRPGEPI